MGCWSYSTEGRVHLTLSDISHPWACQRVSPEADSSSSPQTEITRWAAGPRTNTGNAAEPWHPAGHLASLGLVVWSDETLNWGPTTVSKLGFPCGFQQHGQESYCKITPCVAVWNYCWPIWKGLHMVERASVFGPISLFIHLSIHPSNPKNM